MTPTVEPGAAMRWTSASSTLPDPLLAAEAVAETLAHDMGEGPIDLVLLFVGGSHVSHSDSIVRALRRTLEPTCIAGGSASRVISRDEEIDSGAAITAMAARLPGVDVHPFLLTPDPWSRAMPDETTFAQAAPGIEDAKLLLMIGDPATLDMNHVLATFNRHVPKLPVVGGMASSGPKPGSNMLILNDWIDSSGGVAIALKGNIRADVILSQGCRPIGPSLEVTAVDGHVLLELDGQPALERVEQVLRALPEEEQERLSQGLYVGRPVRRDASGPGDYLIRNLLGADRDRGALAIGDHLRDGEKVRLHLRDGKSAIEDLELLLAPQEFDTRAHGALLFACNGRGPGLFGRPHVDISTLQSSLGGGVPIAGMFCAGEIGPVSGTNFMHGHTAAIAVIRPV